MSSSLVWTFGRIVGRGVNKCRYIQFNYGGEGYIDISGGSQSPISPTYVRLYGIHLSKNCCKSFTKIKSPRWVISASKYRYNGDQFLTIANSLRSDWYNIILLYIFMACCCWFYNIFWTAKKLMSKRKASCEMSYTFVVWTGNCG